MKQFFDMDNRLFQGIDKLMDYVFLSICWVFASIPVVTCGAATTALYHTASKCLLGGEGHVFQEFFRCFKANLKSMTWVTIFLILFYGALYLDMKLIGQGMELLQTLLWAIRLFVTMVVIYIFPYGARYRVRLKESGWLRNCLYLSILYLPRTALLALLFMAAYLGAYMVPLAMILIPSCLGVGYVMILEPVFRKYDWSAWEEKA